METKKYFTDLRSQVDVIYSLAEQARKKGLDPKDHVEIPLAMSMAEKVVGLISTIYPQMLNSGISERIIELEEKYGKLDPTVVFMIAEDVAKQKFCKFEDTVQAIDAGIRTGFAYTTLAVVSSPIEGFTGIKIRNTKEGKEYIEASFSGPIRSAGTTASCLALMLIDYLRELFGYAKYDPTPDEIKRVWTELEFFHERITNLQGMPTEAEALFIAERMPIQVAGDKSEKLEVPNYKNLERVETNFLRSGFCLIMAEGLSQKAKKGFRLYNKAKDNGIKMTGFDWLEEYLVMQDKISKSKGKSAGSSVPPYIRDLVAGRPVYGHPGESGSFRFRYGRSRTSGFSAVSVHPATMAVTDDFIATGTQLKIEKPSKGCAVTSCDTIDGPIVKLTNGTVRKLHLAEDAKALYKDIEEIIYLGDMLFPFSDVVNRNAKLVKPGYVEEWWDLELKKAGFGEKLDYFKVSLEKAMELSKKYKVSLHPDYTYFWTQINKDQFDGFIGWFKQSWINEKLIFPYNKEDREKYVLGKRALELLGIPHEVTIENVTLNEKDSKSLLVNLGLNPELINEKNAMIRDHFKDDFTGESVLEMINNLSEFEIRDKAGEFIGARMGRPEKAKLRKIPGSPHVLFPVGKEGGRLKSIQSALDAGKIRSSFPLKYCEKCEEDTVYESCEKCHEKTKTKYFHYESKEKSFEEKKNEKSGTPYCTQNLDISHYYTCASRNVGMDKDQLPALVKGLAHTSSGNKMVENLSKGILRAKYDLNVNKDGTIRLDATELPIVSFRAKEVGTSVEQLLSMGYDEDIYGNPLTKDDQLVEIMPHDVLIPHCEGSPDEKGGDIFVKISKFVDDELEHLYKLPRFYNISKKEDVVGKLGVCMAPHNCAGVVCRFVGFSNTQGLLASPYMHAAIRRDCDGDEAAIMLLGDVLLNFSREFLPSHRGGTQDAPLVLNAKIDAGEVDDQILDLEMCENYPLELYEKASQGLHSGEIKEIPLVSHILKEGKDPFRGIGFTHDTSDINLGVPCSAYKLLGTMQEKVDHQMKLVERIRSADTKDTARLTIERHFIRDLKGNLRKFSMQEFRCVGCNEIIRRPPLKGNCPKCRGKLIFTIHEGGIKKYMEPAISLAKSYNLNPYLQQSLALAKRYVDSIFGKEVEKQEGIDKWF